MEVDELLGLIKTGEGYTLELKEKLPSDLGKQLCAFTKASEARMIMGVKNGRVVPGYGPSSHDLGSINVLVQLDYFLRHMLVSLSVAGGLVHGLTAKFDIDESQLAWLGESLVKIRKKILKLIGRTSVGTEK